MADVRFYKPVKEITLQDVCALTKAAVKGHMESKSFKDVATLKNAGPKDISFFHNKKYLDDLKATKAGLIFCAPEFAKDVPEGTIACVTDSPYRAFAMTALALYPTIEHDLFPSQMDDPSTYTLGDNVLRASGVVIMPGAKIGSGTKLGPNCVIGPGVEIGANCRIGANVTISHTLMGNRVNVYPGACIGQAGFGFAMDERGHITVPQLGRVIIEDAVEIGSNTTVDRGTLEDTFIGQGTRIDNLVQIAHGVRLGRNCVIVAQVGISGSTTLGDFVIAAGQAGLVGHLNIGDGARIAAQAGVLRDVPKGEAIAGTPAVPVKQWHRQTVALSKLIKQNGKEA